MGEDELKDALRALTPREAVKISLDPVRYLRLAREAAEGEPTELSPSAVHYLTLLTEYLQVYGPEGVTSLARRWKAERHRRASG